jgi:hypothetical protein
MKYQMIWWLGHDDMEVSCDPSGEQELEGVTPEMVREWFKVAATDCPLGSYAVRSEHVEKLKSYFNGVFNLAKYDYFVEGIRSFPGEKVDVDGKTIIEEADGTIYLPEP